MSRLTKLASLLAVVLMMTLLAPAVARADDEVLIDGKGVRPPVLKTTTAHRVMFVNRSGRIARIEFTGGPKNGRVIEVPVQIWAYFDRPGGHSYVVHLGTGKDAVTFKGVIEVAKDEGASVDLPTCDSEALPGMRIMGGCIVW